MAELAQALLAEVRHRFSVRAEFSDQEDVIFYLPDGVQVIVDLDIAWCRIYDNWTLVRAVDLSNTTMDIVINLIRYTQIK